jgi:hypothetical protein
MLDRRESIGYHEKELAGGKRSSLLAASSVTNKKRFYDVDSSTGGRVNLATEEVDNPIKLFSLR